MQHYRISFLQLTERGTCCPFGSARNVTGAQADLGAAFLNWKLPLTDAVAETNYRFTTANRPLICEQKLSCAVNLAVMPEGLASISIMSYEPVSPAQV